MTDINTIINRAQGKLYGVVGGDRITTLASTITISDTTIGCTHTPPADVDTGSLIEVGYELCYVVSKSGNNLVVIRAMYGSTGAAHTAGALITFKPRFPAGMMLNELLAEILGWPPELFATTTVELTVPAGDTTVDLTGSAGKNPRRILAAERADFYDTAKPWRPTVQALRLVRGMDVATFPSGTAVQLTEGWAFAEAATLRVTYAHDYTLGTFTSSTDLQTAVGISPSLNDAAVYGLAARMIDGKETARNSHERQGQSRRAEEVPPQSWMRTQAQWMALRDRRVSDEINRLRATWGGF